MPRVKQIEKRSRKSKNIVNKCKYVIRNKRKRKGYVRVYNRAKQGIKKRVKETENLLSC